MSFLLWPRALLCECALRRQLRMRILNRFRLSLGFRVCGFRVTETGASQNNGSIGTRGMQPDCKGIMGGVPFLGKYYGFFEKYLQPQSEAHISPVKWLWKDFSQNHLHRMILLIPNPLKPKPPQPTK